MMLLRLLGLACLLVFAGCDPAERMPRSSDFTRDWRFFLGDASGARNAAFNDATWRTLDLPHDWSIEGEFSPDHPATAGGGALPGGVGWYRKSFPLPEHARGQRVYLDFDGVYRHSTVWINGRRVGSRPNGYVSFRHDITPFLEFGDQENVVAVRVDNSMQPNSRWYTGSGIYRNVRLVVTNPVHVDHWGTFVTTPEVARDTARVRVQTAVRNDDASAAEIELRTTIFDARGRQVRSVSSRESAEAGRVTFFDHQLAIPRPVLWSVDSPYLYHVVSRVFLGRRLVDEYVTPLGVRDFRFDSEEGFILNGRRLKIQGVCLHHDLGALGAAVNRRAIERQLEILRDMGVNAIRTAHNPPAPELLDLTDRMGFLVMNEAFDVWKLGKSSYDYSLDWDAWHEQDLTDFVLRDRNHPSVIMWSIGNEVLEQWDSSGVEMTKNLAQIVRRLDPTRPIVTGNNDPGPWNNLIRSGALDLVGYNYHHEDFASFPERFPGEKFIATESTSALATRGAYDMPSDSVRVWPVQWDVPVAGNPDHTCSSYDNCRVGWGSTHEDTWRVVRKHDYLSGMFVWTGFDYLGEPTPYDWPARSSYFGILDLAGFPKNAYYLYQSEWTSRPVLHVFPHWNWSAGDTVDVWAYTNAEQVSLFLNDRPLGIRRKGPEDLHLMWRVPYEPGVVRAIGTTAGADTLVTEVRTAGRPAKLELRADRTRLQADGRDLSFITASVLDEEGVPVPDADNLIHFSVDGPAAVVGVDNGSQVSHEPFKANFRHAFNGLALAIVQAGRTRGQIVVTATSSGLESASVRIFAD